MREELLELEVQQTQIGSPNTCACRVPASRPLGTVPLGTIEVRYKLVLFGPVIVSGIVVQANLCYTAHVTCCQLYRLAHDSFPQSVHKLLGTGVH